MSRTLTPRAEIMLSYLTGLGEVGRTVEPKLEWLMADLGYRQRTAPYHAVNELISRGFIRRNFTGKNTLGVFTVLRRLESITQKQPEPVEPQSVHKDYITRVRQERLCRLAEIPRYDTRDLTARTFGDPLFERSALARKTERA